jgi:hypothetical protein
VHLPFVVKQVNRLCSALRDLTHCAVATVALAQSMLSTYDCVSTDPLQQEVGLRNETVNGPRGDNAADDQGDEDTWRDRLVELHILAANGDNHAATAARRWLVADAEARRVWNEVEQDCRSLRATRPAG